MTRARWMFAAVLTLWSAVMIASLRAGQPQSEIAQDKTARSVDHTMFAPSTECIACHNNLQSVTGEDVSIGANWRGSIMANAAKDPYMLASVRREMLDHPTLAVEIEDECASCHTPAAKKIAHESGGRGRVFWDAAPEDPLTVVAQDGVSCTVCHQISSERLGRPESFNGNFAVAAPLSNGQRQAFGPFAPDAGRSRIMHSVTGFEQQQGEHIQQSEVCATCHSLTTTAHSADGTPLGSLPEQMPYQEWRHSAFDDEKRSCQSCHMPKTDGPVRVSSVLGEERASLSRHTFLGGNAFMLRMMNRYREELGIAATSAELDAAARATVRQLEQDTANVAITAARLDGNTLALDVLVQNMTGHKFPTGYPSRRAWLHVVAMDAAGRVVFESGRDSPDSRIAGNRGDETPDGFEPHYAQITSGDQVQIYESVMGTPAGAPTTGLLQATRFLKDNRLLPRGFDKQTATADIQVVGDASSDNDFASSGDRVLYRVTAAGATRVQVELKYQSIGFRWAQNLAQYNAAEPQRFVKYFNAMASTSTVVVARASAALPR